MDAATKAAMIQMMQDAEHPCFDTSDDNKVLAEYLKAFGFEPSFFVTNLALLQTVNENHFFRDRVAQEAWICKVTA